MDKTEKLYKYQYFQLEQKEKKEMQDFIRIHEDDNVAVALRPIALGESLTVGQYQVTIGEEIPQGHKFALKPIAKGEEVIKYGFRIGFAKEDIAAGGWVHVHNLKTALGDLLEYQYEPVASGLKESAHAYFDGYRRADGKVGVRNEIWIIPTVGCVNSIAQALEKKAKKFVGGNVEDVIAFTHPYGCSQMGDDQENTRKVLADMIHHPNAGGVLVLGLGCENSNIPLLKEQYIGEYDEQRVKFLQCQDVEDEQEEAMKLLEELAVYAGAFSRETIDASELVIGMKCGGSDGLSGITANPTVGAFSDLLISKGGTTILTEVPEMFGAETLLMNRCETPELFDKTGDQICTLGHEFGSVTGRKRRCGWIDLVALKYAIMVDGVTKLIMMKSDVLDSFETIKACVAYKVNGEEIDYFPYDISEGLEPVYVELPGWETDMTRMQSEDEFPEEFNAYLTFLEEQLGVPIKIVSVGPDRGQTIERYTEE